MRWFKNAIHVIDNIALNTTHNTPMAEEFNFNKDMLCMTKEIKVCMNMLVGKRVL